LIKPTVGRLVWFTPSVDDITFAINGDQPLAGIIVTVWSDTYVNLAVFDANGISASRTSVLLVQDDMPRPSGYFCEWMLYQKGQAAKADALELAAAARSLGPTSY
jgi:hypothetical protein